MRKIFSLGLPLYLLLILLLYPSLSAASSTAVHKLAVFNFGVLNLEAAPYGTSVASMLMLEFEKEPRLVILDRKTLESFLSLNDLQQRDDLANILHIGSRLGLDFIVSGNTEKRGLNILVNCRVTSIAKGESIFSTQLRIPGDPHLEREVKRLSRMITQTISDYAVQPAPVVVKTLPAAPVNIRIRPGSKRLYLSWENPSRAPAVAGYELFRGTNSGGPFARIGASDRPEYTDQDLEKETTYFYRIRSFDDKGQQSPWSNIAAAKTALTPNPPIIHRAVSQIKAVSLVWSPSAIPSGDPAKLKGYKLYRAKHADGPYQEISTILGRDLGLGMDVGGTLDKILQVSFVDRGLTDGEEYFYRLTAYNEFNLESDFSVPVKASPIRPVGGLTAQSGLIREVSLSWDHIDSPVIKGYFLYRSLTEKGGFTKLKKIDSPAAKQRLSYSDRDGMTDNTTYFYQLTAFDEAGMETSPSEIVTARTRGKPPTPQGFQGRSGLVKRIELTWQPSTETDVEGYMLYYSRTREGKYQLLKKIEGRASGAFSHGSAFDRLEDGVEYFYIITSFNRVGVESDASTPLLARTKPRPTKPASLQSQPFKVKEAPLQWQENPEKDVVYYRIFRSEAREEGFSQIARVLGVTSYVDKNLKDGTTYIYRIQAEDKDELLSDFSDLVRVQTKARPRPPLGLKGDPIPTKVELGWSPSPEPDISHYVIYSKRFLGLDRLGISSTTTFSDATLERGKSRTYVVTAVDKDGLESDASAELRLVGR